MQILNFKQDNTHFYVGHSLYQNDNWLTFQAIDDNGYLGSIHIFKKDKINVNDKFAQEKKFYEYLSNSNKIIDPFNFSTKNEKINELRWTSLSELFIQLKSFNQLISIESDSGVTYTGEIDDIHSNYLFLRECSTNYHLNEFLTKIDYNKIISISPNSIENDLLTSWLSLNTYPANQELVELYFDYEDDERFNTYYIGKIIKESKNQLLFESLNSLGQLDGILLISTKHITHITHQSHELDYYCYLMNYHLQNNTFNPRKLNTDYTLSSQHFIKINNLIGVDNAKFDNTNIGTVKEIHDNYFSLQNIDEYRISDNIQKIFFDDLIDVELTSNEQVLLKDYLNIE